MNKIFTTLLALIVCAGLSAQQTSFKKDSLLFKHLSVGGHIGTTGIGVEVATSMNSHFAIRAGFQVLHTGKLKINLPVNNGSINDVLDIHDQTMSEAMRKKNVELDMTLSMITGNILGDYYPWKNKSFHITAGAYFGNRTILHLCNGQNGEFGFLNVTNSRVQTFNELFETKYQDVGVKFGDYIFTADKNGNLDAKIQVWAVRPYIGVGWGRDVSMSVKRKVNFNFDAGVQFWGTMKCKLNNEKTISSRNKEERGILNAVSNFIFWPSLRLTISGDIF